MNRARTATAALAAGVALSLAGCSDDADVVSRNISKAADNFEIQRRIVFINGITNEYMLTIEGRCAIVDESGQLEVTCKVGPDAFEKHFLGLSDNVTYLSEQTETVDASEFYTRVTFKPQTIVPDVDVRGEAELPENQP